jgi:hypothetical protein
LENWLHKIPNEVYPELGDILPYLNDYLLIRSEKENTKESNSQKETKKRKKYKSKGEGVDILNRKFILIDSSSSRKGASNFALFIYWENLGDTISILLRM